MNEAPLNEATAKKDPLVAAVKAKLGADERRAQRTIASVFEAIREELAKGQQLTIPDFATMKIVEKKAHIVKDPDSGHQYICPAENVVSFVPTGSFQEVIERAKLSSIILAVPHDDTFTRVIDFHFSRVGWSVHVVHTAEECLQRLRGEGAHLVIADFALKNADRLIEEIKCTKALSGTPLIALYPSAQDPEHTAAFRVKADEALVEPFEVYTLLMLAESELARSGEEELIFEHQLQLRFGTAEEHLERAGELANRLFKDAGLDEESQVALGAAFREALGNAAQHGNRDDPGKTISVEYYLDREKITLVVTDSGPGFDHRRYVARGQGNDAVSAARERHSQGRVGGLGVMLMQKCTDRVEYNDIGNQVTLTKYRARAEG